ncbi:MAG: acetylxylan esterase [Candidatus Riflebacteria bacterium]|nr:acetylxylan esterase [Candidatus Riflebacteria bacterium]
MTTLRCLLLSALLVASLGVPAGAVEMSEMVIERDPTAVGIPFSRYFTTDSLGRRITFYVSNPPATTKRLPVVLLIQGSGCQSVWGKKPDGKINGGFQNILLEVCHDQARVVVVEKPGVKFLDDPKRPGTAEGASKEFLEEQTLPRWAEANVAALKAIHSLPEVDSSRTLVMGHSEGGIVAARVAAEYPAVTHVASLAGGGPSQLFDLANLARNGKFGDPKLDADARVKGVLNEWAKIQADPTSTTKCVWSHPYRRWSSFLSSSTMSELLRSKAKVYLAHGTEDTSSSVTSMDVAHAELLAHGRDVTSERIEGVDHGFRKKGEKGYPTGMKELFGRVVACFLACH